MADKCRYSIKIMGSGLSLENDGFILKAAIDSQDTLYKLDIEVLDPLYSQAAEALVSLALEQKISNILKMGACDFAVSGLPAERLLYSLRLLIKRFQGSDVTRSDTSEVDTAELVCRCQYLDRKSLEDAFIEAKGDFKKAILATNASMICSSCSQDVKSVYESMSFEEVEERNRQAMSDIQQALREFSLVCPPEYEQLVFTVANAKNGVVKIKAEGDRQGLGRNQIKKTLENFLPKSSLEGLEISVFF